MNSAAQNQGWREHSIKVENIGKRVFVADGVADRVQRMVDELLQKLRTMLSMRGPDDYEKPQDEDMAERVARILAKRYQPRHVTYNNGDGAPNGNGEKRLLRWILGVLSALAVLTIAGGVTLYGEFTALKATVTTGMNAHEQRLSRVEQRLDRASANTP